MHFAKSVFVVDVFVVLSGFGEVNNQSEMWLGNDNIYALTSKNTELLIQLEASDGSKGYAIYSNFHVADEDALYKLSLGEFSGNISNSFDSHNGSSFATPDKDSCALSQNGGWWFTTACSENALLNSASIKWVGFPSQLLQSIIKTEMKIRRTDGKRKSFLKLKNTNFPWVLLLLDRQRGRMVSAWNS